MISTFSQLAQSAHRRWPGPCVACGRAADPGGFCAGCAATLPWHGRCCPRCAGVSAPGQTCGRCQARPPAFARTLAAFDYAFPVDRLVQQLKYATQLHLGRVLGRCLLARALATDMPCPGVIVPMPLHRRRLAERGFNQSMLIARPLGAALRVPVEPRLLVRARPTTPQAGLGPGRRAGNVRGAFRARAEARGVHVVLVDDVMTSGHTLRAAAAALAAAGAARVDAWVVARA